MPTMHDTLIAANDGHLRRPAVNRMVSSVVSAHDGGRIPPCDGGASACRVKASFAQASLVAAHRALLAAALEDPRNSMFLLVSESCLPLYHPALLWAQLMSESHVSRVADAVYNSRRWSSKMETPFLTAQRFQKSDQWSSLTRMHAELAAHDDHVWPMFEQFCKSQVPPLPTCAWSARMGDCCAQQHARARTHPLRAPW